MATALVSAALLAVETQILAAPSLGVTLSDHLRGVTSAARRHKGVGVWRERTTNRQDERRQQHAARVDDTLVVELSYRVSPKAQRASARAAMDIEDAIIQRVADCDNTALASLRPVYAGTVERHLGEWVIIEIRYTLTRDQQLGGA